MQAVQADSIWDASVILHVIQRYRSKPGAMLPILHGVQDLYGHVPADAVPLIADSLNVSRAEVHGVLTYYHHFRQAPAGRLIVQICRAEACQARGANALADHATQALGCGFHETTPDGAITLEPVYCLGHCAVGPNIAIGATLHARVTPERFDLLFNAAREVE